MHYYQKHISDFNSATRHLTRVERSVYTDAIELYYETEKQLTTDIERLRKLLLIVTDEEKSALNYILGEFFLLTDEGYLNKRCSEEIIKYQSFICNKRRAGKASAEQRTVKLTPVERMYNTCSTGEQLTNNHKPITNNHKPITNNHKPITNKKIKTEREKKISTQQKKTERQILMEFGASERLADDFLILRKSKRAPVTTTACSAIAREAEKAGITFCEAIEICIARSWQGFNASWDWQGKKNVMPFESKEDRRKKANDVVKNYFLSEFITIDGEVTL